MHFRRLLGRSARCDSQRQLILTGSVLLDLVQTFPQVTLLLGFVGPLLRSDALAGVGIALANTLLGRRMALTGLTCDFAFSLGPLPWGLVPFERLEVV